MPDTVVYNERGNPVREQSYSFALSTVKFCRKLMNEQKEYVMSRQLLRSGTSIGANIEEAIHAQSRKDFINKMSISLKEAFESRYWIRLVGDSGFASLEEISELLYKINAIIALLTSIIKTTRSNDREEA